MASLYVAPCTDVAADDGLPTAIMNVNSEKHAVKWDSCARYSVAGSEWMQRGERVRGPVPVDYVEGVGGFLYDVLGLWTFYMRSVFGQVAQVTVSRVSEGKSLIPAINLRGERTRLPNKKELSVWIPFETDMELLELNNELEPGKVDE
ncbi:hypothetical protein PF005_g25515 [Phytophthora fragariae]|uniref:Uncharacterized protein n=1 Tax=Phytophthora fragariae TaxID=53985 RepID=A0A6A3VX79_9STRA|nr:hypothetical protein PF011_g23820 [Phytophthora fragariae]KAE9175175.1 hypothetical protein PF005_g25515 [Phytophthora fragariae]KAE9184848.1 hypothetical protein PF002_g26324 [Phytophthora fragariae]KAE9191836.1 hypothetical protein PF004_g21490 [Phytophthora fragariae]